MSNAPRFSIDLQAFTDDPYPILAKMRAEAPIAYVPELDATLFTRRDDIHLHEKRTSVFSSEQPDGLMTRLMGQNLMRKDGEAHMNERRILFPAVSPKTVQSTWLPQFHAAAQRIVKTLKPQGQCDLVRDYAMPISAEALKAITGLTNMAPEEMDRVSQAMIDGCSNYTGDPQVEVRCHNATASIDAHIDAVVSALQATPDKSALSVQMQAGLGMEATRANIKLIISGGQNEPRDAIAGTIWALLNHPTQLAALRDGQHEWGDAFTEYVRWMSPIGMSPRQIAQPEQIGDISLTPGDRVFFMFASACRDEDHFTNPDQFDISRNTSPAISFGAGPHFCAGAAATRALLSQVALPLAFANLPNLRLTGDTPFTGWAFRGPTQCPVAWDT